MMYSWNLGQAAVWLRIWDRYTCRGTTRLEFQIKPITVNTFLSIMCCTEISLWYCLVPKMLCIWVWRCAVSGTHLWMHCSPMEGLLQAVVRGAHLCTTALAGALGVLNVGLQPDRGCPLGEHSPAHGTHWLLRTQALLQTARAEPRRSNSKKHHYVGVSGATLCHRAAPMVHTRCFFKVFSVRETQRGCSCGHC